MYARFPIAGGSSTFYGESGQGFPSSSDGTVSAGAIFRELNTGVEWYYDGEDWRKIVTREGMILDELVQIRRLLEVIVNEAGALTR